MNEPRAQLAFNELVLSISDFLMLVPIEIDPEPEGEFGETIGAVNAMFKRMKESDLMKIRHCAEYIIQSIDRYQQAKKEVKL